MNKDISGPLAARILSSISVLKKMGYSSNVPEEDIKKYREIVKKFEISFSKALEKDEEFLKTQNEIWAASDRGSL